MTYGKFIKHQRRFLATKDTICLTIHGKLKSDIRNETNIVNGISFSN